MAYFPSLSLWRFLPAFPLLSACEQTGFNIVDGGSSGVGWQGGGVWEEEKVVWKPFFLPSLFQSVGTINNYVVMYAEREEEGGSVRVGEG